MIKYKDYFIILIVVIIVVLILKSTAASSLFYNKEFSSREINFSESLKGENYVYRNLQKGSVFSYTPYINLNKGKYKAIFSYNSDIDNEFNISIGKEMYTVASGILPAELNEFTLNFELTFPEKDNGFKIMTFYNGNGYFELDSIIIKYDDSNINSIFLILVYIVLAGIIIFKFIKKKYCTFILIYISIFYLLLSYIFIQNLIMLILFSLFVLICLYFIYKKDLISNFNFKIYCFFILLSFIVMFFCTKSSPFYIFNDWNDSQSYFTMGKGMFNGKIIYKDLFEQKGPLFYFIYGIGYLICNTDFYGVYFLEALFFAVSLIFIYKLSKLFLSEKYSFISTVIFTLFILNGSFMKEGGSAEQFLITFQSISLYYFIAYFKNKDNFKHSPYIMFIHGIMGASVLLIKLNVVTFWIGFGGLAFLSMLLNKEYKLFVKNMKALILGISLIVIPFVIYFWITDSMKDFYNIYVIFNSKYSPLQFSLQAMKGLLRNIIYEINRNFVCASIISIGIFMCIGSNCFINIYGKIGLVISILFLTFSVYGGISQLYYFFVIAEFSILGIIVISYFIQNNIKFLLTKDIYIFYTLFSLFLCIHFNGNYKASLIFNASLTAQEKFTLIMNNESSEPTLLNLLTLDNGFYTKSEIIPNIRFFQKQNISYDIYPDNIDIQNDALLNKKVEFVVYRSDDTNSKNIPNIWELNDNYDVISMHDQYFRGIKYRYYLYKVKLH